MNAESKKPAGVSGPDSARDKSETNSRSNQNKRKLFVREMYRYVPEDLRILKMQFRGDPAVDGNWWARPLARNAAVIDDQANVYFTCAAFRNKEGTWRRRKDQFGGGVLLMIDDLGTGPGSKFPLSKIDELPPTALIETSPENFQAIYMFDRLVTDQVEFNALINAFIRGKFLDQDTGMKGVARVFRPPFGVNGKSKYGGWRVQLAKWAPERRYSVKEIVEAFGLDMHPEPPPRLKDIHPRVSDTRIDNFELVVEELQRRGKVRGRRQRCDWLDIYCPWEADHSGGDRSGAAIAFPNKENQWFGGFRCHHGHCEDKGWSDLTDWLAAECSAAVDAINRSAPKRLKNGW